MAAIIAYVNGLPYSEDDLAARAERLRAMETWLQRRNDPELRQFYEHQVNARIEYIEEHPVAPE